MIENLQLEDFTGRIGEKFRLETAGGDAVEVELIDASGMGGTEGKRPPFSVVFRIPEEVPPRQAIYRLAHDEMETMDLFLVPVGPAEEGIKWEAVFT